MKAWYNNETGDYFGTREEAMRDALEQFYIDDPAEFPNDDLPYVEVSMETLKQLLEERDWWKEQ